MSRRHLSIIPVVTSLPHSQIKYFEFRIGQVGKTAAQAYPEQFESARVELEHLGELLLGCHRLQSQQRALMIGKRLQELCSSVFRDRLHTTAICCERISFHAGVRSTNYSFGSAIHH